MTVEEAQDTLEGGKGDDAQFELMKTIIADQIDRAFKSYNISTSPNIHKRSGLHGTFINYNSRGQSNDGRPGI